MSHFWYDLIWIRLLVRTLKVLTLNHQILQTQYYSPHKFSNLKKSRTNYFTDTTFSMLHNNARSLKRNQEDFQTHLLSQLNFNFTSSCMGITESKIRDSKFSSFNPEKYLVIILNLFQHHWLQMGWVCTLGTICVIQFLKNVPIMLFKLFGLKFKSVMGKILFVVFYIDNLTLLRVFKIILKILYTSLLLRAQINQYI